MANNLFNKVVICITILICSCSRPDSDEMLSFSHVSRMKCHSLKNSPFLGLPMFMNIKNNYLFITDFHGDSLIVRYNLKNNHSERIAPKGPGPDEFQSPLVTTTEDNSLFVFDKREFEFGYYNLNSTLNDKKLTFTKLLSLQNSVSNVISISNQKYLASGIFKKNRYAIINKNGKVINYKGNFPDFAEGEEEYPVQAKAMFHQSWFLKNSQKKLIVSISSHVAEVIDISPKEPKILKTKQIAKYNYSFTTGNRLSAELSKNYQEGISDQCANKSRIYLLFNSSLKGSERPRKTNEIFVLDWNLKPIKKIIPDRNIKKIAVNQENEIYGIIDNQQQELCKLKK